MPRPAKSCASDFAKLIGSDLKSLYVQGVTPEIVLVIPCYNEEKRIDLGAFANFAQESSHRILFVDDGSTDGTLARLTTFADSQPHCRVHALKENSGKAEAVRQGLLEAREVFPDAHWYGFWDADLATPLFEVQNMLRYHELFGEPDTQAIFGSRVSRLGSTIVRSSFRHYVSRIIVTLISVLFGTRAYDSQCGSKLFTPSMLKAFEDPFVTKWIFDVEVLIRTNQDKILEYPLRQWIDVAGSKVRFRDGVLVFKDIYTIWKHYKAKS